MIDLTLYWPAVGALAVAAWWWIAWTRKPRIPGARKPDTWMASHERGEQPRRWRA